MKRRIHLLRKIVTIVCEFLFLKMLLAHQERTDENGGHHDYQNKSGHRRKMVSIRVVTEAIEKIVTYDSINNQIVIQ